MGLQMTLDKVHNHMNYDFINAYWVVTGINYTTTSLAFSLECYPTREAYHNLRKDLPETTIGVGSAARDIYSPLLYSWMAIFPISTVFPNGIPLDENDQKTILYNWVKFYTGLPFTDVFEED